MKMVSTGSWGCGAFYNNERVMFVIQVLAANLAGVDLTHHTLCDGLSLKEAFGFLEEAMYKKWTVAEILDKLADLCENDAAFKTKFRPPKTKPAPPDSNQAL